MLAMHRNFCVLLFLLTAYGPVLVAATDAELERFALTVAGDADNGQRLFLDRQRLNCVACHQVAGKGGDIGPDLTAIGGKFDRPHLIESLLAPSQQIVEGYRSSSVLTTAGQVVTGVIKAESDQQITLFDATAQSHTLLRTDIERIVPLPTSIMPTGLGATMTPQEFADLIAYLETLRSGGKTSAGGDIRGPIQLPPGFEVRTLATGLTGATAMEVLPDGRILVCEQTGTVRVIRDGKLLERPLLSLSVNHEWERGVIGVTIDPNFETTPYVYVCWTGKEPYPHHRVSRFEVVGDQALPETEKVLLVGDDQGKMGGQVPAGHQGGALHFGPDGKLYIAIGEQTAGTPSQHLDTFLGKMLRIDRDGNIPLDNPLRDQTEGKYQAIWAYGLRNPFTFAIRPSDGLMLINDVGGTQEEINVGQPGGNYGWPIIPHGVGNQAQFIDPIHWYPEASISGGDFLGDAAGWPSEYAGRYFFADFKHGWIHSIDPQDGQQASEFASGLRRPVDLRFDSNGRLLVLLRNAWVIDGKFEDGTSSMLAITPPPAVPQ